MTKDWKCKNKVVGIVYFDRDFAPMCAEHTDYMDSFARAVKRPIRFMFFEEFLEENNAHCTLQSRDFKPDIDSKVIVSDITKVASPKQTP